MSEDTNKPNAKKRVEKLKAQKKEMDKENYAKARELISTRAKIEGDYDDDVVKVTFNTSPETRRTILAKKPSNKEMIVMMKLSAEAAKYEGSADPESLIKMVEIYEQLSGIAGKLSIDESLDSIFWNENVSFSTLQDFVTKLIIESQKGTGVSEEELKKFR